MCQGHKLCFKGFDTKTTETSKDLTNNMTTAGAKINTVVQFYESS